MIDGSMFSEDRMRARERAVTVCVPARNEAAAISRTVAALVALRERDVIDRVLVLDGSSHDDTAALAAAAGADVCDVATVFPALGPVLGKGDSMWRGLSLVETPVVVFIDADLQVDHARLVCGLAGPLLADGERALGGGGQRHPRFVKGAFHRRSPDFIVEQDPFDGGRVTELMARPLMNLLRPDLAGFYQPLGGQVAGEVALLRSIPMLTGYAVEIGMLVDVVDRLGAEGVAQVDLGELRNRPRPTSELAPMAQEVLYGFLLRVAPEALTNGWQPYVRPRFGDGFEPASAEVANKVVARPALDEIDPAQASAGG